MTINSSVLYVHQLKMYHLMVNYMIINIMLLY